MPKARSDCCHLSVLQNAEPISSEVKAEFRAFRQREQEELGETGAFPPQLSLACAWAVTSPLPPSCPEKPMGGKTAAILAWNL